MRNIVVLSVACALAGTIFACESRPRDAALLSDSVGISASASRESTSNATRLNSDKSDAFVEEDETSEVVGNEKPPIFVSSVAEKNAVGRLPGHRSLDDPSILAVAGEQVPLSATSVLLATSLKFESTLTPSGYEPKYEPALWNDPLVRLGNNCYAYACNDLNRYRLMARDFPQPGVTGGLRQPNAINYTVDELRHRAIADGLTQVEAELEDQPAPSGYYKTALFVQSGVDYHWYRQDPDGYWSHKLADGQVARTDAGGNLISDPRVADRDYVKVLNPTTGRPIGYNYTQFAGFFYVPEGGLRLLPVLPNRQLVLNFSPQSAPHFRPRPGPGPGRR